MTDLDENDENESEAPVGYPVLPDEENLTDEEAKRYFEDRLYFHGDAPNAITWDDEPSEGTTIALGLKIYGEMRDLAFHLAAHRQAPALGLLTEAARALREGDVGKAAAEVGLAKGATPANLVQGIIENLFSSLGQMLETTVQQFRGITNPLASTGSLVPSLGFAIGPNLQGWPTL